MAKKATFDAGDCHRPACDDIANMMQQAASASSVRQSDATAPAVRSKANAPSSDIMCPPGSAELGRSSWSLLHSMAAWFPDTPSDTDQQHMRQFVAALARFYPCTWCARDFTESIAQHPVRTETRTDLCLWLCEQHNLVNVKTGKPIFECKMKLLDERWRQSDKDACQGSSLH